MKIGPLGAELFHAGGRTDGRTDGQDEANNRFRNSANAPKNHIYAYLTVSSNPYN